MAEAPHVRHSILTLDEIKAGLSELAQHGDGAQRTQAYRLLMNMGATDTLLPEPMNEFEREERMIKLMRAIGPMSTRRAYVRAFPNRPKAETIANQLRDTVPDIGIPVDKWPRTLRQLYVRCPDLKPRGGMPKGYPVQKGLLAQQEWVKKTFLKYHQDKQEAGNHAMIAELEIGTDYADDSLARDGDDEHDQPGSAPNSGEATPEA